jgi:hypothetical protein
MNHRSVIVILGAALALSLATAPAHAARGVRPVAEHKHQGRVVAVHHHPGKGEMTVTIRVHNGSHHSFHVTRNTAVEIARGKARHPATVAALHHGAHVTIYAHRHMADKVTIHHKKT